MPIDLFEFWSRIEPSDTIHPEDRAVFKRVGNGHGFNLNCLPSCFSGPLRTAPVVLLYLSPGFSPTDLDEAASSDGQTRYKKTREGFHPLPNKDEHLAAWKWWESRTRDFGAWQKLSTKIAVLNIGAYHSTSFTDYQLLAALPSCRVSLDWAQNCLFPEAVAGKRAVICLRSSRFWGLQQGQSEGSLYAPTFHRGGFIQKNDPLRPAIIKDVQQRLGTA
jgi:hypothetical protein